MDQGTHFGGLAEDQSLLQFSGQLDRDSAEALWQSALHLCERGYRNIRVDMSGAGPALAEGALALLEWSAEDADCKLELIGLSDDLMGSLQIYGVEIQNRRACFGIRGAELSRKAGFEIASCPHCGVKLRIRQTGSHLCPRCGVKFQAAKFFSKSNSQRLNSL